ncbi:MAG: 50S ribosomal protein L10 [bacterium]|nr:50S ribosomal protein L10 [bacterium]
MNKLEKQELVAILKEKLLNKNFVLAGFNGLTVTETSTLKNNLREANCESIVVKNRLLALVFKEMNLEGYDEFLKNTTFLTIQYDSKSFEAIKVLKNYSKENESFFIKSGYIDGQTLDVAAINRVADLPSKEVLIAQLLATMNAPISNFVYVLNGNISKLVLALEAIKNKKEQVY